MDLHEIEEAIIIDVVEYAHACAFVLIDVRCQRTVEQAAVAVGVDQQLSRRAARIGVAAAQR